MTLTFISYGCPKLFHFDLAIVLKLYRILGETLAKFI